MAPEGGAPVLAHGVGGSRLLRTEHISRPIVISTPVAILFFSSICTFEGYHNHNLQRPKLPASERREGNQTSAAEEEVVGFARLLVPRSLVQ